MKTYLSIISIGIALATSQAAFAAERTIVKADALPGNLQGGAEKTAAKYADGVPSCMTKTRAKVAASDEALKEWVSTHEKHACATAGTLYVCRAGKNLSVRCE